MFQTPILLITFNRPEHTRQVFEIIKQQKPARLFVFQDAPREGNMTDIENCKAVKTIFDEILDWTCELKYYSPEKNLGCGKGPSTGISWFFEQEEQGIIFEDDCLAHPDFFQYCEELLDKYKNTPEIGFIAGSSFQNPQLVNDESYYFGCGSFGTWGWASWRRAWEHFDYYLESIDKNRMTAITKKYFKEPRQRAYWMEIYRLVKKDRMNDSCWDYQFYMSCWNFNMLAIIPYHNLITNIGYDEMATHTMSVDHPAAKRSLYSILPINHPVIISLDTKADLYVQKKYTYPLIYGWTGFKRIPHYINRLLKIKQGKKSSWL
ncbi:MAG: hypothetical protein WCG08_14360 [Paludibacter sp.]